MRSVFLCPTCRVTEKFDHMRDPSRYERVSRPKLVIVHLMNVFSVCHETLCSSDKRDETRVCQEQCARGDRLVLLQ